jgi:anti-anti-sigma factor
MAHASEVAGLLDDLAAGGTAIVVDLTPLEFIDSSGIHALVRPRSDSARIELVCPPGNVRRVLEVTKLERVLQVYNTLDEAFAATG